MLQLLEYRDDVGSLAVGGQRLNGSEHISVALSVEVLSRQVWNAVDGIVVLQQSTQNADFGFIAVERGAKLVSFHAAPSLLS